MKIKNLCLTLCASLLLTSLSGIAKEVKIGMAIDDLRLERWQKDRDIFVNKAESLGAKVFVQSANGNEETQMSQIENMINRGVDVLVIIPYNGQVLSNVIKEAKQEGIKVKTLLNKQWVKELSKEIRKHFQRMKKKDTI